MQTTCILDTKDGVVWALTKDTTTDSDIFQRVDFATNLGLIVHSAIEEEKDYDALKAANLRQYHQFLNHKQNKKTP